MLDQLSVPVTDEEVRVAICSLKNRETCGDRQTDRQTDRDLVFYAQSTSTVISKRNTFCQHTINAKKYVQAKTGTS